MQQGFKMENIYEKLDGKIYRYIEKEISNNDRILDIGCGGFLSGRGNKNIFRQMSEKIKRNLRQKRDLHLLLQVSGKIPFKKYKL